jgi:hypothetical protein
MENLVKQMYDALPQARGLRRGSFPNLGFRIDLSFGSGGGTSSHDDGLLKT